MRRHIRPERSIRHNNPSGPRNIQSNPKTSANGGFTVSLDPVSIATTVATSTCAIPVGQLGVCDTSISAVPASNSATFRVGAILNATTANVATSTGDNCVLTNPMGSQILCGVFGWQFQINYDPTVVTPVGDPSPTCAGYPDCGASTIWYGSQTGVGSFNWAAGISSGQAGTAFTMSEIPATHTGFILVGYTFKLPTGSPIRISARTVLANVAFELVGKGAVTMSITNVVFVDQNGVPIVNNGITMAPTAGPCSSAPLGAGYIGVTCGQFTANITNDPPHASFTSAHAGTLYTFTSTSTDTDDAITSYVWDFGDKTSPLTTTSPTVTHDYGINGVRTAPGSFVVTMRAVDAPGATGAARDAFGKPLVNLQPSHATFALGLVELGPQPSFVFTPSNPNAGTSVSFDGSSSTYPDEPILAGTAPIGGTALMNADAADACLGVTGSPCPIGFVDNNGNGVFDPGVDTVVLANDGTTICNAGASPLGNGNACDIMAGPAITPAAQPILTDLKISFYDTNANGNWDPGESVIYDTNGNSIYDGIKTYSWDFGDPASGASNTGTGITTTHTFNPTTTTTFTVMLTVTDNVGGTNSITHSVIVTVVAVTHNTSTSVTCPSTAFVNQGVTCTATVTDTSTSPTTSTGAVNLSVSGVTGTFTTWNRAAGTTAGTATVNTTFTATTAGSASIIGTYPGDTGHNASPQSAAAIVTVNPRTTTTGVTCAPSPVLINQGSVCTATVTDTAGGTVSAPTPTGTLGVTGVTGTFTTCNLTAGTTAGTATCTSTFTASTSGTASIVGTYSGDSSHAGSSNTATPASVGVNKRTTTVSVTCSPATIDIGQTTLCTASVTDSSTAGTVITPTGTATFNPPATGICTLAGTGATATCSATEASTPFPGTLMGTATFAG